MHPNTQVYSEHWVVSLVMHVILQFQKEVEATNSEMKRKERKMAKMHLQMKKTKAELEWHETYFRINEQERAWRNDFVESHVEDIPSEAEGSVEETVFSSRGGSIEGSQVSLSGEKHDTHPNRYRESKHRRDQGEREK